MATIYVTRIPHAGRTHYMIRLIYGAHDRYETDLMYCTTKEQVREFIERVKNATVDLSALEKRA